MGWIGAETLTDEDAPMGMWTREELGQHVTREPTFRDLRDRDIRDRHRDGEPVEDICRRHRISERTFRKIVGE